MPPKRKAAASKAATKATKAKKPEPEVKKRKLSEALAECSDTELPDEIPKDVECPAPNATVYIDRDAGIAYDVMLNQSNVSNNNNKYFLLQILYRKANPTSYAVWFRWGRVGYTGQTALHVINLERALALFKKKFKDKTGNDFDERDEFQSKAGKYDWIKMDYSKEEPKANNEVKVEISKPKPVIDSKLHPKVKGVVDLICDMTAIERYLKAELNYDAKKAPLGRITKAQIKSGFLVLSKIEKKLLSRTFDSEFERLVNEYYTKIPHDFGFRRPSLIKTMDEFKRELALIEALADVEITQTAMKEEEDDSEPMHISDKNYAKLNCTIKPLDVKDPMYQMVEMYMINTHGPTHHQKLKLHNVFEIDRQTESDAYSSYSKNIPNRALLWHGSGISNWFGILSQGLRIAPPEAPVSGYMFGKGVYFADCCSKSAGYLRAGLNQRCFMALAEVALGKTRELKDSDYNASDLPKGHHSTHGVGRNHPDEKEKRKIKLEKRQVVVPCGKIVERKDGEDYCLYYNEFIVYNTQQIRLRYLLEVELVSGS